MVIDWILWGVIALMVLIALYLMIERLFLYPHEFTLKQTTKDVPIVIRTRAREITKKNGEVIWKVLWKKKLVPVPPEEARAITKKGKFYVEGWLLEDGQVQYETHPQAVANNVLSTNQRIMLAHQFRKAEKERIKGWKDIIGQVAVPIAFGFFAVIIIVVGLVQWTDINGPGLEMADRVLKMEQEDTRQLEILNEIKNDIQLIKSKAKITENDEVTIVEPPN